MNVIELLLGMLGSIVLFLLLYYLYLKPKRYNVVFHYGMQIVLGIIGAANILYTVNLALSVIGLFIAIFVGFGWFAAGLFLLMLGLTVVNWLVNVTVPFKFMVAMRSNQKEHQKENVENQKEDQKIQKENE